MDFINLKNEILKYGSDFSLDKVLKDFPADELDFPSTPPELDYKLNHRHYSSDLSLKYSDNVKNLSYRTSKDFLKSNVLNDESFDKVIENNKKSENFKKFIKNEAFIYLFITYSLDSEAHYKNVINLKNKLEGTGKFKVFMDAFEQQELAKDMYEWMNSRFEKADFIVPVISSLYKITTEAVHNLGDTNDHVKQTKYIFALMQKEIYDNNFQNKRIRPLVLNSTISTSSNDTPAGIVTRGMIPNILSNTIIYQWPRDDKEFCRLLLKRSRP